jgi:uncharacterized membrane protein YvbJ
MTKSCPNCKGKNRDSAKFCEQCGNILNGEKTIKNKSKINNAPVRWFKKQNTGVKIVGFCLFLFVILGIVIFLFIFIQTLFKVHPIT